MYKYFKVRTEEEARDPLGKKIVHKRTEYVTAKDSGAIVEDYLRRYGEHLLSLDSVEVDEKRIKRNTRIYVVV